MTVLSRRAYLDHASTSPPRESGAKALAAWQDSADPGRVHTEGRMAREALEAGRAQVAELFGTRSRQVVFTSGATESINSAVSGALGWGRDRAVVMADVEHRAVRECSLRAASQVLTLPVDGRGVVDVGILADLVGVPGVGLVHCQLANHEVGTVQPVAEAAAICRRSGIVLHVDAAAGCGHVPIPFDELGVDLMSVTAHKMGGPRGIGALLVRRGLRIEPLIIGGDQERARRAGMENVGAAVAFGAVAAELGAPGALAAEARRLAEHTDRLRRAAAGIPDVDVYGPDTPGLRLPHLVCLGIGGVEAEPVLIGLDQLGVAVHSGSSCSSESLEPSPVLEAMGVDAERSLRLSVGWSTTDEDIDMAVDALPAVIGRLRALMAGL
jgi:cysteine desulfurase